MPDSLDIIWDLDGVLSDFTLGFKNFVRRFYGIPLATCGGKKSWQFRHLASAEEDDIWRRIAKGEYDWSEQVSLLTPSDHIAIAHLRATQAGLPVRFQYVTSRLGPEEQVREQSIRWLRDTGLPDYGNVTVTNDKVPVVKSQFPFVGGLIDDDIRNVAAYRDAFNPDIVFLRDWQYNRETEVAAVYGVSAVHGAALCARRVSSISEFCYAVLERIDGVDRG